MRNYGGVIVFGAAPSPPMRMAIGIAFLLIASTSKLRAELYEFTLQGEVTYSLYDDINVGDPVQMRYLADTFDRNPQDPYGGDYRAWGALIEFPSRTINTYSEFESHVEVISDPNTLHLVTYYSRGGPFWLTHGVTLPIGFLQSDELPISLQVDDAHPWRFRISPGTLTDFVRGNIVSYNGARVPEPTRAFALLGIGMLYFRR